MMPEIASDSIEYTVILNDASAQFTLIGLADGKLEATLKYRSQIDNKTKDYRYDDIQNELDVKSFLKIKDKYREIVLEHYAMEALKMAKLNELLYQYESTHIK